MTQFNEAELCSTVLIPYLQALNIPVSNITLERTFFLRLGHTVLDIKGNEKNKLAGRLDVLVRNSDGNNLFIVELKAPDVELTDDDANQGISYARLLDQIAPFVIVTNGKTSKVYDSISKKEIDASQLPNTDFWTNSRQLSTQDDLNIRFEALQHFLGYSSENLQNFCLCQRKRGMSALVGSQSNRKFNPNTYVKRENVRAAINCFLESNSVAFAILGASGVGKTNEVCSLAEELGCKHIVLFINATEISESIDKTLSNEFNWGFSENIGFPEIIKRLTRLGRSLDKKVILIIDSLDESEAINIERSISELASNITPSSGIVKLIVSIKITDWPRFSDFKGTISKLHLSLDKSWYNPDVESRTDPRPFVITDFNEVEKSTAIEAYSKFYDLSFFPEGSVKNFCKQPFLLRVVSELYSGGKDIPRDISEELLIGTWIRKKLEKSTDPDKFKLALISLARAIFTESNDKAKQQVTYSELWRASINTIFMSSGTLDSINIFKQLESIGFITVQHDYKDVKHYSFYYGPVRDYFLARYILKLDELTSEQLSSQLPAILDNSILRSALFWHLRQAPISHSRAVNSMIAFRAEEFVDTYNEILNSLFPALKHCLPPYTGYEIGVCFRNSEDWLEYAVYPIIGEQRKKVTLLNYAMQDKRSYKEIYGLQAEAFKGGGANFLNEAPKLSAAKYALEAIREAIEKGNLNESQAVTTLQEGVLAILSTNEFLHANSRLDRNILTGLPLDLDYVHKEVQLAFGRNHYQHQWIDEFIKEQQKIHPNQTGFSIPRMPEYRRKAFEDSLAKSVEDGKVFDAPSVNNHHELKVINDLLIQLSAHNKTITEHTLPPPYLSENNNTSYEISSYSSEILINFVQVFYFKAIESYKEIAKTNFPGLTHKLSFLNNLPSKVFAEIITKYPKSGDFVHALIFQKDNGLSVTTQIDPEQSMFKHENENFLINGVIQERYNIRYSDFLDVFSPRKGPAYNAEQASFTRKMPIRTFVYEHIKSDFEKISAEDLLVELELHQLKVKKQ